MGVGKSQRSSGVSRVHSDRELEMSGETCKHEDEIQCPVLEGALPLGVKTRV